MSRPSFSMSLFTQLVRRLQHTNARYDQIAYQCRRTQRPTHHAKRRAYRVGLRIDTSKAAWPDSAASTVLDRIAHSPVWVATETEIRRAEDTSGSSAEDAYLPNPWPELPVGRLPQVVAREQPATSSLSPLELWLSNIDDMPFRGPVPGAPRWRTRPLPEDETEAMTNQVVSFEASRTYDTVWRGVITTRHVSDSVSIPLDVGYGGLGITVPLHHKKRKLDADETISRLPGRAECGYVLGPRWSEAQRRPRVGL